MPVLSSFKMFEHHDLINLYFSDVTKKEKLKGKYLEFNFYKSNSDKEHYLFLKNGNKIIALCCFFFYEVQDKKIPTIDIVVVEEEYRRKGIVKFFYNYLLEKYSCLVSGNCLNKNSKKQDGSFGLWTNYLFKKYEHGIFDVYSKKIEKYSFWKSFKSPRNIKRRLIIWKKDC